MEVDLVVRNVGGGAVGRIIDDEPELPPRARGQRAIPPRRELEREQLLGAALRLRLVDVADLGLVPSKRDGAAAGLLPWVGLSTDEQRVAVIVGIAGCPTIATARTHLLVDAVGGTSGLFCQPEQTVA